MSLKNQDAACRALARNQFGLLHRSQVLAAGMSPRGIDCRLAKGEWEVLRHNVYRYASAAPGWHQDLFGLHLWSEGGIATGRSAAALHDLRGFKPGPLEIAVPKELLDPPGVKLARLGPSFPLDPVTVEGIPCARVEMTIVRLAATTGLKRAGIALDDALRRRLTTLDDLSTYVEDVAIQGRNGITRTRALIESRDKRHEQLRGESENDMLPLFDGVRLPIAEVDYEIWRNQRLVAIADFAYPGAKIDIEADSHSFHDAEADAEHDKRRDRSLSILGWTVLRFTRREIREESARVVRDIRAQLDRVAPELLRTSSF